MLEFLKKHWLAILICALITVAIIFAIISTTSNDQPPNCTQECLNQGTSTVRNGQCACNCRGAFTGTLCERDACPLFDKSCSNNGQFLYENNTCSCKCDDDHMGLMCQDKIFEFRRDFSYKEIDIVNSTGSTVIGSFKGDGQINMLNLNIRFDLNRPGRNSFSVNFSLKKKNGQLIYLMGTLIGNSTNVQFNETYTNDNTISINDGDEIQLTFTGVTNSSVITVWYYNFEFEKII